MAGDDLQCSLGPVSVALQALYLILSLYKATFKIKGISVKWQRTGTEGKKALTSSPGAVWWVQDGTA